jgi:hypothetical protein
MPVLTADANPGTASWATSINDVTAVGSADGAGATNNLTLETGDSTGAGSGDLILRTGTTAGAGQTKGTVRLEATSRPQGWNGLSPRYELHWVAGQRGKPGLNADILSTKETVRMVTDPDFEVLGTSASSDDVTFNADFGGLLFTTDGGANDQVILNPHLDVNQSAWNLISWGTADEVHWECDIQTDAAFAAGGSIIWAGLKLTNTSVTATDADQAFFRYQDSVAGGNWQAIDSIADTDNEVDTGVTVAVNTSYHLKIVITAGRLAQFYINGFLVSTSAALTDVATLRPYIGVQGVAAAETLRVFGQAISRTTGS